MKCGILICSPTFAQLPSLPDLLSEELPGAGGHVAIHNFRLEFVHRGLAPFFFLASCDPPR
jgi:hypothetical protein